MKLTIAAVPAAILTAADRQGIASLVTRFIDYPPHRLAHALDTADYVWICRDEHGAVVGTTAVRAIPARLDGRTITVIYTSAVAIDPAYRRLGLVPRMGLRSLLRERLAHPTRPVYWLALAASPAGYLQMVRSNATFWPRRGAAVPPRIGAVIDQLVTALGAPDAERVGGCVRLRDDFGVSDPSQAADRWDSRDPDVAFFLRVNPDYRRGSDLVCLASLTVPGVIRAVVRALVRAVGRRRAASPMPALAAPPELP